VLPPSARKLPPDAQANVDELDAENLPSNPQRLPGDQHLKQT